MVILARNKIICLELEKKSTLHDIARVSSIVILNCKRAGALMKFYILKL